MRQFLGLHKKRKIIFYFSPKTKLGEAA